MVRICDFPQLRLIAWNLPDGAMLDDGEALALYERNWRFVDRAALLPHERRLIERLAKECGRGILHV